MSEPTLSNKVYDIPGKVFLLGEYAALGGLPAWIVTIPPRFQVRVFEGELEKNEPIFHEQSPAGRLMKWIKKEGSLVSAFEWIDPHEGLGGFGASTAQFALLYLNLADLYPDKLKPTWSGVWEMYRTLCKSEKIAPSGADLVGQWLGGVTEFDRGQMLTKDHWNTFDWSSVVIFSATGQKSRKQATHDHLKALESESFLDPYSHFMKELNPILNESSLAMQTRNLPLLGTCVGQYAQCLNSYGLELNSTSDDRTALQDLPGVLGVKGVGALQADGILVIMDSSRENRQNLIKAALNRGLRLVCNGLTYQPGIRSSRSTGELCPLV